MSRLEQFLPEHNWDSWPPKRKYLWQTKSFSAWEAAALFLGLHWISTATVRPWGTPSPPNRVSISTQSLVHIFTVVPQCFSASELFKLRMLIGKLQSLTGFFFTRQCSSFYDLTVMFCFYRSGSSVLSTFGCARFVLSSAEKVGVGKQWLSNCYEIPLWVEISSIQWNGTFPPSLEVYLVTIRSGNAPFNSQTVISRWKQEVWSAQHCPRDWEGWSHTLGYYGTVSFPRIFSLFNRDNQGKV